MRIWILNHYATDMFFDGTGRHQALGKYLVRAGHEVKIFCANTVHNSDIVVDTGRYNAKEQMGPDDVPYIFIKTKPYKGNGIGRIRNMVQFWKNVKKAVKNKVKEDGKPDIILASSVHPLTLVAGIQIKKKLNIPCVCEIRDIWPLTLVEFNKIKEKGLVHRVLLRLELWTYLGADKIIFTVEGGKKYIEDMGWKSKVNINKIYYINNGVDIELFDYNKKNYMINDDDLENENIYKIIYTGSIGEANQIDKLIDLAEEISNKNFENVKFLVYGDGAKREILVEECKARKLSNIVFKGHVSKKYIPFILSKGNVNIFFIEKLEMYKYGLSLNKMFEYMASGKPIITNLDFGFNLIVENNCGISSEDLLKSIEKIIRFNQNEYEQCCTNARNLAYEFSYESLALDLMKVLTDI